MLLHFFRTNRVSLDLLGLVKIRSDIRARIWQAEVNGFIDMIRQSRGASMTYTDLALEFHRQNVILDTSLLFLCRHHHSILPAIHNY